MRLGRGTWTPISMGSWTAATKQYLRESFMLRHNPIEKAEFISSFLSRFPIGGTAHLAPGAGVTAFQHTSLVLTSDASSLTATGIRAQVSVACAIGTIRGTSVRTNVRCVEFGLDGGAVDAITMQTASNLAGEVHVTGRAGFLQLEVHLHMQAGHEFRVAELPDVEVVRFQHPRKRFDVGGDFVDR